MHWPLSATTSPGPPLWRTALTDAPDGWSPVNYYSGFLGPITVDRAIQQSVNTVAAKVVQMLTPAGIQLLAG